MILSTYQDVKDFTTNQAPYGIAENEDEELIIITHTNEEDDKYYTVETYQNNGWIRKNIFHEDGTTEELYEKET